MDVESVPTAKFVSHKVNKIRWQPVSKHVIQESKVFATGSWDNDVNFVTLWSLEERTPMDHQSGEEFIENMPLHLCMANHVGDVTDLDYVSSDYILTSSSAGSVYLYKHHSASQTLSVHYSWEKAHHFPSQCCPCTGLSTRGDESFVSVGEDGRMCIYNMDQRQAVRIIEKADSCTLNGVLYMKQNEIAAVNSTGQLKVWDIRQPSDEPVRLFLPTGEKIPLHCLDKHPTQPHIVVTGGEDGALSIWDMRQDKFPVTLLAAHSADMWEVKFHPSNPDNLFTCSQDGAVWHWDSSGMNTSPALLNNTPANKDTSKLATNTPSLSMSLTMPNPASNKVNTSLTSPWLASEASKHRMDITDVLPGNTMPVNSVDINGNTLLCGTDAEQVVVVKNLVIK